MGFGVKQETVFLAFTARRVSFAPVPNSKHRFEVVGTNGVMNVEYIPPELGRQQPQRLSEVYEIPLAWFYNPLLIPIRGKKPN
jgi:hypothetical protein